MLVLAEVKLSNRSFTEENPTVTVKVLNISELGSNYVAIDGQVYLSTATPISQSSISFRIECINRSIRHASSTLAWIQKRAKEIQEDIDNGVCKPEWATSHLNKYQEDEEKAKAELDIACADLELYQQFVITK